MKTLTRAKKNPPLTGESAVDYRARLISQPSAVIHTRADLDTAVAMYFGPPTASTTLVIPDIHAPADHVDAIPFLEWVHDTYKCDNVISIGDVVDLVSISFHPVMPENPSPSDELEIAAASLAPWHKAFPGITVTIGNHDARLIRKTVGNNVPSRALRPLAEILEIPTWSFVRTTTIDGVYYAHNLGGGANGAARQAPLKQMPCVAGHVHSSFGVAYSAQRLWGMQVGTLIDFNNPRFDYAREGTAKANQLGCGVVIGGHTPIVVPLEAYYQRPKVYEGGRP